MERTANALSGEDESFSLRAPTDALAASAARASAARRRMALVGAGAAALLGAFAFLAAGLMRRDLEAERARLRRRGAHGLQLAALDAVEGLGPALAGVLAGGAVAIAVTLVRAHDAAVPAGTLVSHALLSPGALLAALACWVVAGGVVAIGARRWGPASGRIADALAIGAALALALALARGGARAGDPGDPLPTLLVPLALLVAALVLARAAPSALRAIEVAARRGPLQLRMAALGVARGAGGPALTVAVVALSCALACFAAAYRSTLQHGASDQAAFRVPMDVTVAESGAFVAPFVAAPPKRWRALAGGGPVVPVIRRDGSLPGTQTGMTVLGVPAGDLAQVRQWRPANGASRDALARRLRSGASAPPAGPAVRVGDRDLRVRVRSTGDALNLTADLVGPDGSVQQVFLGRSDPQGGDPARAPSGGRARAQARGARGHRAGRAGDHQRPPARRAPRRGLGLQRPPAAVRAGARRPRDLDGRVVRERPPARAGHARVDDHRRCRLRHRRARPAAPLLARRGHAGAGPRRSDRRPRRRPPREPDPARPGHRGPRARRRDARRASRPSGPTPVRGRRRAGAGHRADHRGAPDRRSPKSCGSAPRPPPRRAFAPRCERRRSARWT